MRLQMRRRGGASRSDTSFPSAQDNTRRASIAQGLRGRPVSRPCPTPSNANGSRGLRRRCRCGNLQTRSVQHRVFGREGG